jgi:MFS family permease
MLTAESTRAYSWHALGLLTIVSLLNYLDRTLIYILFTPIKNEMSFSSRKNMIAAGLAVWSLFSGLTGFANGFWSLLFCRVMVGVGEATLGPAALSLLSDYFPPRRRASVQSIYASLGLKYGWRWAFYFLGFPGLLFAVFVFLLKEQKRGRTEVTAPKYTSDDWKLLLRSTPLRYHYAGYALFAIAANSLSIWAPTFFTRAHGYSIRTLGIVAGLTSLTFGISGTLLGGFLSDRLRRFGPVE